MSWWTMHALPQTLSSCGSWRIILQSKPCLFRMLARGLSLPCVLCSFVKSSRRTQVLQHMPPERRKFVQSLASVYRVDTAEVDQEPHRSVQLMRRIDTRIPVPLLSQSATSAAPSSKLVDLRSSKATASAVKTVNIPPPRVASAWKMPSSSSRNAPSSGAPSSGPLPPHSSGLSPPSYVTLQPQAQREQPATIARKDVPEDWEDDI
ncbi:hypothetical protein M404DRAFT_415160 [Pisolithus tinctorius Marx 270]|uniref:R3H domain-containing protein n=1 Tax=Pisolithus tinctorius Marx 270 TaxID=870435 RepID=A0A0C3IAA0_PISTI|nr:hypothetical protein M404DRAFT_415160 [Pisolithus tinctorius Marx 270]